MQGQPPLASDAARRGVRGFMARVFTLRITAPNIDHGMRDGGTRLLSKRLNETERIR